MILRIFLASLLVWALQAHSAVAGPLSIEYFPLKDRLAKRVGWFSVTGLGELRVEGSVLAIERERTRKEESLPSFAELKKLCPTQLVIGIGHAKKDPLRQLFPRTEDGESPDWKAFEKLEPDSKQTLERHVVTLDLCRLDGQSRDEVRSITLDQGVNISGTVVVFRTYQQTPKDYYVNFWRPSFPVFESSDSRDLYFPLVKWELEDVS